MSTNPSTSIGTNPAASLGVNLSADRSVAERTGPLHLEIEGMHCEACVRRVTQALTRAALGEVEQVRIGSAEVAAPDGAAAALVAALDRAGFTSRVRQ